MSAMNPVPPSVLVLFAHGARDPGWAQALERLAQTIRKHDLSATVELAYLELMQPDLPSMIDRLARQGTRHLTLLPVFWSAGGHVIRDLPLLLDAARARHHGLTIDVLPVLSDLPGVLDAVAMAALNHHQAGIAGLQ